VKIAALLVGLLASASALDVEKRTARVWVTTDEKVLAGCQDLGSVSNTSGNLDLLRKDTLERRGDVILLSYVDRDKHLILGHAWRCGPATADFPLPSRMTAEEGAAGAPKDVVFVDVHAPLQDCTRVGDPIEVSGEVADLDLEVPLRDRAYNAQANVVAMRSSGLTKIAQVYRCAGPAFDVIRAHAKPWAAFR
jgi:hypothetical protein